MTVIEYCTEEVSRQGHDIITLDGIERVGWMLNAWGHALRLAESRKPLLKDVVDLGKMVELYRNASGTRKVGVRVGRRICPEWYTIAASLEHLFENRDTLTPLEFYRQFEEIHPFVDGNGRTGKIFLNWLGGTLLGPVFPPNDFWGYPIRNP